LHNELISAFNFAGKPFRPDTRATALVPGLFAQANLRPTGGTLVGKSGFVVGKERGVVGFFAYIGALLIGVCGVLFGYTTLTSPATESAPVQVRNFLETPKALPKQAASPKLSKRVINKQVRKKAGPHSVARRGMDWKKTYAMQPRAR